MLTSFYLKEDDNVTQKSWWAKFWLTLESSSYNVADIDQFNVNLPADKGKKNFKVRLSTCLASIASFLPYLVFFFGFPARWNLNLYPFWGPHSPSHTQNNCPTKQYTDNEKYKNRNTISTSTVMALERDYFEYFFHTTDYLTFYDKF